MSVVPFTYVFIGVLFDDTGGKYVFTVWCCSMSYQQSVICANAAFHKTLFLRNRTTRRTDNSCVIHLKINPYLSRSASNSNDNAEHCETAQLLRQAQGRQNTSTQVGPVIKIFESNFLVETMEVGTNRPASCRAAAFIRERAAWLCRVDDAPHRLSESSLSRSNTHQMPFRSASKICQ